MTARATRLASPLARDALRQITDRGGCIRPVQLRRTNLDSGEVTHVLIPCGSTFEAVCPACAKRAQGLRAEQYRDGWHLENEPPRDRPAPDEAQQFWLGLGARDQVLREQAAASGQDTTQLDQAIAELDDELAATGIRGTLGRTTGKADGSDPPGRYPLIHPAVSGDHRAIDALCAGSGNADARRPGVRSL